MLMSASSKIFLFSNKAHFNSFIKHIALFKLLYYFCEITGNNGLHTTIHDVFVVSDVNKNISGSTDRKKGMVDGFAYPYSPPHLRNCYSRITR